MTAFLPLDTDPTTLVCGDRGAGLLLVHGGGSDPVTDFGHVLDGLAARYRVAATHFPGSGPAPRATRPLQLDDLVDLQVAAADRAGLGTFSVAAFSMGCPVAIRLAARHPARVRALVLVAGFARPDTRLQLLVRIWRDLLVSGDRARLADFVLSAAGDEEALDHLQEAELALRLKTLAARLPDCLDEHLELIQRIDVRADLSRVSVPTLVVAGTRDRLATARHSRAMAKGIPGAFYTEVSCGHTPIAERPDELLDLLTGFVS